MRARQSDRLRATIAAGKLDAHFAANAERARVAAAAAVVQQRAMREVGIDLPHGTPATGRMVLAAIVTEIEAGAKLATAVKRSPISYSAFHAGLARHPDLRQRVDAAKARRREG